MDKKNKDKIEYGNMPVHRYKKGNEKTKSGHPHVVAFKGKKYWVSVGLTSDKPGDKKNQSLQLVKESSGKISRLKRNATIDLKKNYDNKVSNIKVDKKTEEIVKQKCINKVRREINEKKNQK